MFHKTLNKEEEKRLEIGGLGLGTRNWELGTRNWELGVNTITYGYYSF